ncbi:hypothetical protein C9374_005635 [Naegleria lovaniensis]|uniref:C2 domain-containing protein n=1 Tax=Naegleria lovaniensis TaxID=51637 RepID=A0AA88GQ05_NAELO|nr:uncharacterized protein C9374_005635 [Naegleria lovaniensis]KAG2382433.1 hypothetical protein C9374_005635 [Naegleria lovaniensis]
MTLSNHNNHHNNHRPPRPLPPTPNNQNIPSSSTTSQVPSSSSPSSTTNTSHEQKRKSVGHTTSNQNPFTNTFNTTGSSSVTVVKQSNGSTMSDNVTSRRKSPSFSTSPNSMTPSSTTNPTSHHSFGSTGTTVNTSDIFAQNNVATIPSAVSLHHYNGPIIYLRISRVDYLNTYPVNSSSSSNSTTSTPSVNNNNGSSTPSNNNTTSTTTPYGLNVFSAFTSVSNSSSSPGSYNSYIEKASKFSIYNPYIVVQYGKVASNLPSNSILTSPSVNGSDNTSGASSTNSPTSDDGNVFVFEQKTKVVQNDIFPIWNTCMEFPLLNSKSSLPYLSKYVPSSLFSNAINSSQSGEVLNQPIDSGSVVTFKVMNQNRYRKDTVIAQAELKLSELSYLSKDEKVSLKMRKPGEVLASGKTDLLSPGDIVPDTCPILHLDIRVDWTDKYYKRNGDDDSAHGFSSWSDAISHIQHQEDAKNQETSDDEDDDDDPLFRKKQITPEMQLKIHERILNQCEVLKMISLFVPKKWHILPKPDKLILISPTQFLNEEIFTDSINIYYVYEQNSINVMEDMLKNCEKRPNFEVVIPLHKFRMLSKWEGFRFSCYYSLYKKVFLQDVICIQSNIGITYVFQYVTNCGGHNKAILEKLLERVTLQPTLYAKELDRPKIWCGAVPLGWRTFSKDHIVTLVSPFQCNSKLSCTDNIQLQPFLANMTVLDRIHFILEKLKEIPDFDSVDIIKEPFSTNLFDLGTLNEDALNAYTTGEQCEAVPENEISFEPPFIKERRKAITSSSMVSQDNFEEAYGIIFAVRLKSKTPNVESNSNNNSSSPSQPNNDTLTIYYQKSIVIKMKNVDYQLHAFYKSSFSNLPSEGALNRLVQALKLSQ